MGQVVQLNNSRKDFIFYVRQLQKLCEKDLSLINSIIIDKLDSDVPLVQEIASHLILSGGKRLRPLLTSCCFQMCKDNNNDERKYIGLAAAVEFIHAATLLHDDVIDNSDLRRGTKTSNAIWGNQSSILVGDYLLSRCFEMMVEDGSLEILKLLSSTSSKIAQGEVSQLEYKGEIDILEEKYFNIINSKTAALFAAATRVGACITNKSKKEKDALESYGRNLGLSFQIADDALDYYSTKTIFGKEIGKDFYEGKVTLPIIFLCQKANSKEKIFLEKTFRKRNRSKLEFNETQNLIKKYGSIDSCFKRAEHFINISFSVVYKFLVL